MKATHLTLEEFQNQWSPAPFRVVCYIEPNKSNGLQVPYISMIGNAEDLTVARRLIIEDKRDCQKTFGLFSPIDITGRHYMIFEAEGWRPVE